MRFILSAIFILFQFNVLQAAAVDPGKIEWKTGQVVLISEVLHDPYTFVFEVATGSRFGHVGIVAVEKGEVFVYEANPPQATKVPIGDFLSRSQDKHGGLNFTVSELPGGLDEIEQNKLIKEMNSLIAKPTIYNFAQVKSENGPMNCSEFVHHAFKAIGKSIGKYTTLKDLNHTALNNKFLGYIKEMGLEFTEKSLFLSPMSLLLYGDLAVVESTLEYQIISEKKIIKAWNKGAYLAMYFEEMIGYPKNFKTSEEFVEDMIEKASDKPYKVSCIKAFVK